MRKDRRFAERNATIEQSALPLDLMLDSSNASVLSETPRPLAIGPLVVDPPILQAPMAGFTNYAYRQIVRQFGGAGLQATEMVSARGFLAIDEREHDFPDRLWGVKDEP